MPFGKPTRVSSNNFILPALENGYYMHKSDQAMTLNTLFSRTMLAIIGGLISVIPFATMEVMNKSGYGEGFPIPLFIILWLVGALFLFLLSSGVRMVRVNTEPARKFLGILMSLSSLFFVWYWIMVVVDQMPCFLGAANCD
jgi:hypothetical protein